MKRKKSAPDYNSVSETALAYNTWLLPTKLGNFVCNCSSLVNEDIIGLELVAGLTIILPFYSKADWSSPIV